MHIASEKAFENHFCDICGGRSDTKIGRPRFDEKTRSIDGIDQVYVVKCKACEFYYIYPKIDFSREQVSLFYNDGYFGEMTEWWQKKRALHREERLDTLQKIFLREIRKFLDIGCGEGYVLQEATRRRWKAYGLDVSNNLKVSPRDYTSFFVGELEEAKYPDSFFDAIYMDSILEHVLSPSRILKEVYRILTPGGVIYIGVPNEDSLFNFFKRLIFKMLKPGISSKIEPFRAPYHVVGFTKESLTKLSGKLNFKLKRLKTLGGTYEWRKFLFSTPPFWISLLFIPIHYLGLLINEGYYIEAYVLK